METNKRTPSGLDPLENDYMRANKRIRQDRFIPNAISQIAFDIPEKDKEQITKEMSPNKVLNQSIRPIIRSLLSKSSQFERFGNVDPATDKENRVLNFSKKPLRGIDSNIGQPKFEVPKAKTYSFNTKELKILDAPGLEDSFYYNLVDLSLNDLLAVCLNNHLYTYNIEETATTYVTSIAESDVISAVKFSAIHDEIAAIGSREGLLQLVDVPNQQILRSFKQGTHGRICSLDWKDNVMANGTKIGTIYLRDIRTKDQYQNVIKVHSQEVCAVKFNPFNSNYMITGGNDDTAITFDIRMMKTLNKVTAHKAAVKALAWSNVKENVFASGGGSGDRKICLWDINNGKLLNQFKTQSQVCNLGFNCDGLLAASFGSTTSNLCLIDTADMRNVVEFNGHTSRVLYMTVNQKGNLLVTGSSDETLRFWNVQSNNFKHSFASDSLSSVHHDNIIR